MKSIVFLLMLTSLASQARAQSWVDTVAYPFASNFLNTPNGKLHYVDEGQGEVILFVHGTPTWSFLYRQYIQALSLHYRCIAVDHLGFGLSDKPRDFAGTPQAHHQNLALLIDHLGLDQFTLVVHDFGGPIGLGYAVDHPEKVKQIVLFNTWLWATKEDPEAQKIDRILHSPLGNFLYLRTNFSPTILLKQAYHNKKLLTRSVHGQYQKPFPNRHHRYGLLHLGQSLVGSSGWYDEKWKYISRIANKPCLVLWGLEDTFITPKQLQRWQSVWTHAEYHTFEAGHFVQEEKPRESLAIMEAWLEQQP